jgi:hypothetical protein
MRISLMQKLNERDQLTLPGRRMYSDETGVAGSKSPGAQSSHAELNESHSMMLAPLFSE